MAEVFVNLGANAYRVHIGAGYLQLVGQLMRAVGLTGKKALVVSDEQVGALYGGRLLTILAEEGYAPELCCVAAGEGSKSLQTAEVLYTQAIRNGLDRKSPIIALGGGVVGDLAGFVASTFLRGVPFVQIPTTILAQVDSSVGGKVAINHQLGKNLIGSFYQPRLVVIDSEVLHTLPDRELWAGLAEVIKYGIITGYDLFEYLTTNHVSILNKDAGAIHEILRRSCEIKAGVVEQDEHETGLRIILNFGHTIAHAIEASGRYMGYNHGEAVAIGMYGAALISYYMGLCKQEAVEAIQRTIAAFRLPSSADLDADLLFDYLARDKKTVGGKTNWVLIKGIGEVIISNDVTEAMVHKVLKELTQV